MANVLTMSAAKKSVIDRIEPTDWYVGMKNPQVQLMVYGQGIRDVQNVTTDYPGVTIDILVRLDSPNYLLVYLNLRDAQPGMMTLTFGKTKVPYQLKAREMSGDQRMGFTNADLDRRWDAAQQGASCRPPPSSWGRRAALCLSG